MSIWDEFGAFQKSVGKVLTRAVFIVCPLCTKGAVERRKGRRVCVSEWCAGGRMKCLLASVVLLNVFLGC